MVQHSEIVSACTLPAMRRVYFKHTEDMDKLIRLADFGECNKAMITRILEGDDVQAVANTYALDAGSALHVLDCMWASVGRMLYV